MNKTRKPKSASMHPVLRAQLRSKWIGQSVDAQIHALMGDNKELLLAYGSVLMSVASACAIYTKLPETDFNFRVIRGAINALDTLRSKPSITYMDRGSIYAGLLASQTLIETTPIEIVSEAAYIYDQMNQALEKQHEVR